MSSTASITTRRSLMKGVAWAAPVAAVAITAPALAASPPVDQPTLPTTPPTEEPEPPFVAVLNKGESCKATAGVGVYRLTFTLKNTDGASTANVELTSLAVDPNSGSPVFFSLTEQTVFTLAVGGEAKVTYVSDKAENMANGKASATFTYTDESGEHTLTQEFSLNGLPVCR